MKPIDNHIDLTIVGGGITGLTAAYLAAKSGLNVRVIEGSDSFGGLIKTFKVGGNKLECFYHHFFLHDIELNWLLKELDIADKVVSKKTTMGIYTNKKLHPFSTAIDLLKFKPLNIFDKLRFAISTVYLGKFANWKKSESISAIDWFTKYTGKNVVHSVWKPLLKVKFGKYFDKVPIAWMIGRLKQRFESREAGSEKLLYLDGSLQVLLDALLQELKKLGVELILNEKVDDLIVENNELKGVKCSSNSYLSGKTLFTIPHHFVSNLMKQPSTPLDKTQSKIEYFGAICYVLELKNNLSSYYWLNVADNDFPFGGIIEHTQFIDSEKYNNKKVVYLSKYFSHSEEIASMPPKQVEQLFLKNLKRIFPNFSEENITNSHFFKTNTAATVCDLNFSEKVPKVETDIKNLYVCNMAHVYPDERSVNNSIRIAANTCKVIGIQTPVPNGNSLSGLIGFKTNS